MNVNQLNLKYNPFDSITPTKGAHLFWAGMPEIKDKITNIYSQSFHQTSKKIILNWGTWGGGKTHAAYYFAINKIQVPDSDVLHIYTQLEKTDKDVFTNFIKNIIIQVGMDNWYDLIQENIKSIGQDEIVKIIINRTDETTANTIIRLFTGVFSADIIRKYVRSGLTNAALEKLRLDGNLKSEKDYTDFLTGLLIAATFGTNKRVFLWIDELEEIIRLSGKEFNRFNLNLRDLLDKINEQIIVFMNITFSENDLESVKTMFSSALWSRITDFIRFSDMNLNDAKLYYKEARDTALIDNSKPFLISDELAERVLQTIPVSNLTPRKINDMFNKIIVYALSNDKENIEASDINKLLFDN